MRPFVSRSCMTDRAQAPCGSPRLAPSSAWRRILSRERKTCDLLMRFSCGTLLMSGWALSDSDQLWRFSQDPEVGPCQMRYGGFLMAKALSG
jgi:hypothetical protein